MVKIKHKDSGRLQEVAFNTLLSLRDKQNWKVIEEIEDLVEVFWKHPRTKKFESRGIFEISHARERIFGKEEVHRLNPITEEGKMSLLRDSGIEYMLPEDSSIKKGNEVRQKLINLRELRGLEQKRHQILCLIRIKPREYTYLKNIFKAPISTRMITSRKYIKCWTINGLYAIRNISFAKM